MSHPMLSGRRARTRPVVAFAVGLVCLVASAAAAQTAVVSGTVTDDASGAPIAGVTIQLDSVGPPWIFNQIAVTDAAGAYAFTALPAASYRLQTYGATALGYFDEHYGGLGGPPIVVADGSTVGGIDFALTLGGSVSGVITDVTTGVPLDNVQVVIYRMPSLMLVGGASTGPSGVYTIGPLASGTYVAVGRVWVGAPNYVDELYDDIQPCVTLSSCPLASGTPIVVTLGAVTSGVNFALNHGGIITGVVTDAVTGLPIAGAGVGVADSLGATFSGSGTDAAGAYSFGRVPAGSWVVRVNPPVGQNYSPGVYNNGTPLLVTAGATHSGINISLVAGGRLTGTITDAATGGPLSGVQVYAVSSAGAWVGNVSTDAAGGFLIDSLATGLYMVGVGPSSTTHYGQVLHDVSVTAGATTTVNVALWPSSSIFGLVEDAVTGSRIRSIGVELRTATGGLVAQTATGDGGHEGPPAGTFSFSRIPFGTYVLRTRAGPEHVDEAFDNIVCIPECAPTAGTVLTAAPGVNFFPVIRLAPGGGFGGRIVNAATAAPLTGVAVNVYAASGQFVAEARTNATGDYVTPGLPPGIYYARTANTTGFRDEIFNALPFCAPSCQVTSGQPIPVPASTTVAGVDFALVPNADLVQNGNFAAGLASWGLFATPDMSYVIAAVNTGVLEFHRLAPPPGSANQAVVLQATGAALPAGAGLVAQFTLGNTSTVRKRISVLVHDSDFSDLASCTFWLPPQSALRRYSMRAATTKAWTNATVAFYAASAGSQGGAYQIDDVSLQVMPGAASGRTDCLDALAQGATAGPPSPTLVANGDFSASGVPPAPPPAWALFGNISGQVTSGVFEFVKLAGLPAGVILQPTGQSATTNEILTATFQLGNTTGLRRRVTVLLHDADFNDLSACTFWVPPGLPLSTYTYRTFATEPWANVTLSIYPSNVATPGEWIQLDNVVLQRTPATQITATACLEPGASPDP